MRWIVLFAVGALLIGCDKRIHEAGLRAPGPVEVAQR
ncbi:MAG: hypothetical protein JWO87_1239 [Phycisphaerales bacterium]|nr:hypothetical protein [Phycisphaerales bacterium]MDB5299576.1 hypothetical protein [Phycisphaerales bacterium]